MLVVVVAVVTVLFDSLKEEKKINSKTYFQQLTLARTLAE